MRIVEGISGTAAVSFDASRHRVAPLQHPAQSADHTAAVSRTLIPLESVQSRHHQPRVMGRPVAAFIAHLIATERQEPQTRLRRRAEPEIAIASYAAAANTAHRAPNRVERSA
ncbi:MAG TPA: hypothetical protein VHN11_14555 [Xanthobacteraceae bacterium]|jgi:hypothetical protein|nr:hypothetical protein [Xanthobacteraceae bacterium]